MKANTPISDDLQKEIALRAYFIWEREGYPDGREQEHWALAEAEVLSEQPAKKSAHQKITAKAKTNGTAKQAAKAEPVKPTAKAEPAKPAETVKAAAKSVKAKKTVKAKKPAPKA
jgi:hypothetical protein